MKQKIVTAVGAVHEWWIDHLWIDLVLVVLVTGAHGLVVALTGRFDVLGWLPATDRRGVYSAAAIVISLVAALSGVAVGQTGSAKGSRIAHIKREAGDQLAATWRSIYRGALTAALIAVMALALDSTARHPQGYNGNVARWAFEFGLGLAIMKFLRLSTLFHATLLGAARDDADDDNRLAEAPTFDEDWFDRQRERAGL